MQVYGELIRAMLQISASDLTPTATGLIYWNTSTGIKTYNGSGWLTYVDLTTAQTLTTKTLTTPLLTESSSPGTPSSGSVYLYAKSDHKIYKKDSTGVETEVGSSSGAGGRNYFSDYFDGLNAVGTVTNGITATGNRSSGQTTWGADDTTKLTIANNTSSPLRQTGDLKITHVTTGTAFVESPMVNLDLVDLGKAVTINFDITGNTLSGDFDIVVMRYNSSGTYQETISVAGTASSGTPASALLPTGTTKFNGFFISSNTQSDFYSLRFRRLSAIATTSVQFDSLFAGPQSIITGSIVTDWQSFTPTGSWVTNSTYTGRYRRVGADAEIQVKIETSGAPTAAALSINMPTGLTINTTNLVSPTSPVAVLGVGVVHDAASNEYPIYIVYNATSSVRCFSLDSSGTYLNSGTSVNATTPATFGASDYVHATWTVPISEWSNSNTTLAERAVEEYASNSSATDADDTTSFVYGLTGSAGVIATTALTAKRKKRVRFTTAILPTDVFIIEINIASRGFIPLNDFPGNAIGLGITQNTTSYGISYERVSSNSTDIDVYFGQYSYANGATYASAGASWSTGASSALWRLRKVSGGASVGYPISATNIVGDTNPIGTMLDYAGTSAPLDYLMCDGSSLSTTTYALLFNIIGYAYGGAGASFNIPDFRGRFARYTDDMGTGAASRDTGRVLGSSQTQTTAKNGLSLSDPGHTHARAISAGAGGSIVPNEQTVALSYGGGRTPDQSSTTGITLGAGDSETRPINLSCNKIIKVTQS